MIVLGLSALLIAACVLAAISLLVSIETEKLEERAPLF